MPRNHRLLLLWIVRIPPYLVKIKIKTNEVRITISKQ